MILLDTSGIFAAIDGDQPAHAQVADVLTADPGPRVLSPFVLAETDYFILTRTSVADELRFLDEVAAGVFTLAGIEAEDMVKLRDVIARYHDLGVGVTDASIVVLADRYCADRVLTLDERHFRALRTLDGRPFTLLPADA